MEKASERIRNLDLFRALGLFPGSIRKRVGLLRFLLALMCHCVEMGSLVVCPFLDDRLKFPTDLYMPVHSVLGGLLCVYVLCVGGGILYLIHVPFALCGAFVMHFPLPPSLWQFA